MTADATAPAELMVVAGEASGDARAGALLAEIRRRRSDIGFVGAGGDRMRAQGMELLHHERDLAVVGFTEVVRHLGTVRRAMNDLLEAAVTRQVRGVLLVDYTEFNMRLAARLRRQLPGTPIVYYISPQVWAWRPGRVHTIGRLVDRMLVILPFEKELYAQAGVAVDFVGHPLVDEIPPAGSRTAFARQHGLDLERQWIGLLPGSRSAEVRRLLPPMLGAAAELASQGRLEFLVPAAAGVSPALFDGPLGTLTAAHRERVHLIRDNYYELLHHARAAVVCSGTATLETAMVGTPEVVVYKTSWLTYNLGKLLVRIRDIGLVNVVGGRRGVPELLQGDVTAAKISAAIQPLIEDGEARSEALEFLAHVRARLGEPGASARAASVVLDAVGLAGSMT